MTTVVTGSSRIGCKFEKKCLKGLVFSLELNSPGEERKGKESRGTRERTGEERGEKRGGREGEGRGAHISRLTVYTKGVLDIVNPNGFVAQLSKYISSSGSQDKIYDCRLHHLNQYYQEKLEANLSHIG